MASKCLKSGLAEILSAIFENWRETRDLMLRVCSNSLIKFGGILRGGGDFVLSQQFYCLPQDASQAC